MPRRPSARPGFRFVPRADPLEDRLAPAARVQFFNASPFAAGAALDVYVNGDLVRDRLPFAAATPLAAVPTGSPVTIAITPGDAFDDSDPLLTITRTFEDDTDTFVGLIGDPAADADGIAFGARVFTPSRSEAVGGNVDVLGFAAVPDADRLDFAVRDAAPFVAGLGYAEFSPTGYAELAADAAVFLDVAAAGSPTPDRSYKFDLTQFAGAAVTLAAVGLEDPTVTGIGNAFAVVAVGADGSTLQLDAAPRPARLQLFNNNPFPAFRSVDVYINDVLVADDLPFRAATRYLTVRPGTDLRIDISPGTAADNSSPLFSTTLRVGAGGERFAQLAGNPQATAGTQAILLATDFGLQTSGDPTGVAVRFAQGAADSPPVDIKFRGFGTVADDVPANGLDPVGYFLLPADAATFDVAAGDGIARLGSFATDLSGRAGTAAVVATSGFLSPIAGDAGFGLVLVPADGGAAEVLTPVAGFAPPANFAAGGTFGGRSQVRVFRPDGTAGPPLPADGVTSPRVALADVNGDGTADLIVGTGPGVVSGLTVRDGRNPDVVLFQTQPFEDAFTGGVFVAAGDLTGDGRADIVISPDEGGGPRIDIFAGAGFGKLASFFAFRDDPDFRGGVRPAVGDLNADGVADLTVSAGFGGGPRVSVFDGRSLRTPNPSRLLPDFFAFETTLRNGAFVAVGDVNGDGFGDIVAGAGPGGGPRVLVLSGRVLLLTGGAVRVPAANFFAGDPAGRSGVSVAVADVDGDYQADVITGQSGGGPQVRAFPGRTIAPRDDLPPPPSSETSPFDALNGVFVG